MEMDNLSSSFHAYSMLSLSVIGLAANLLVCLIIVLLWSSFRTLAFTRSLLSLTLASSIYLLANLLIFVPCSLSNCHYLEDYHLMFPIGSINSIGYYVYQITLLHISMERFLAFYSKQGSSICKKTTLKTILLIWMSVICYTIAATLCDCHKIFDRETLKFVFDCEGRSRLWKIGYFAVGFIAVSLMIILYVLILIHIHKLHRMSGNDKETKNDIRLALQFFLICIFSWLSNICFFVLPKFLETSGIVYSLLSSSTSTLSVSSNSVTFLIFNHKIRNGLKIVLGLNRLNSIKVDRKVEAPAATNPSQN